MYYRAKQVSKKIDKRIKRHKRTRYHNDAYLFDYDQSKSPPKAKKRLSNEQKKQLLRNG